MRLAPLLIAVLAARSAAQEPTVEDVQIRQNLEKYSALICAYQDARAKALDGIKREKRYSKVGGVVSLTKLHQLQTEVGLLDDELAAMKRNFRKQKASPLACKAVAPLAACIAVTFGEDEVHGELNEEPECSAITGPYRDPEP